MAGSRKRDVSLATSLLAATPTETTAEDIANITERLFEAIPRGLLIPIERIEPWERQPRKVFDEASLGDLAGSIAEAGVLEPLIVRRDPARPGHYLVVAGHRRLLAARRVHGSEEPQERARVATLPCVVRETTDAVAFADALIENLVRKDLTRREVMDAIKSLKDEYGWTIREIGRRTGRDHKDLSELVRIAEDDLVAALVAEELITPTAAGPLVEARNHALRAPVIKRIRAGDLRTGIQIERAIEAERARQGRQGMSPTNAGEANGWGAHGQPLPEAESEATDPAYGQVGDIPHLTINDTSTANVDEDMSADAIPVTAHTRRRGVSARADALAQAIMAFVRQEGEIDRVALRELERAHAELAIYLERQRAAQPRTPSRGRHR